MSAPDLPPPTGHAAVDRPVAVHLTPALADAADLHGSVVIMVDVLRASTTIAAALAAGAIEVRPFLTVEAALAAAAKSRPRPLLGGERAGKLIPGFDLGNSPRDYTAKSVGGRAVFFTTTNGTAALLAAAQAGAAEVLIGSLANLSVTCARAAAQDLPVHILCAGTRDRVTLDDCIAAGAMVERLLEAGHNLTADDSARLCLAAWHLAEEGGDAAGAMAASRGGRNLAAIGLERDVADCAQIDRYPVVLRYGPATGAITL
ncbi:MAG: 2-phosphosulfolactate phosphatase [Phycisphaerales bacterium]|nr:2-phosphosulfolactate phosphatase [Phycisphaerales bacterium]